MHLNSTHFHWVEIFLHGKAVSLGRKGSEYIGRDRGDRRKREGERGKIESERADTDRVLYASSERWKK